MVLIVHQTVGIAFHSSLL